MSVLSKEHASCRPCANLRARRLEPDPPHAFPAHGLRSAAFQASNEGQTLAPLRPAAPRSAPVVCTAKIRWTWGVLPSPSPGSLRWKLLRSPRVCPTVPRPSSPGTWGPGGALSAPHLHLEAVTCKIYRGVTTSSPGAGGLDLDGERKKGNST